MVVGRPEKNVYFPASWAKFPFSRVDFPPMWVGFPYVFLYFFPSKSQNFLARSFPFCLFFPGMVVGSKKSLYYFIVTSGGTKWGGRLFSPTPHLHQDHTMAKKSSIFGSFWDFCPCRDPLFPLIVPLKCSGAASGCNFHYIASTKADSNVNTRYVHVNSVLWKSFGLKNAIRVLASLFHLFFFYFFLICYFIFLLFLVSLFFIYVAFWHM